MRLPDTIYEYIKEEAIDLFVRYNITCIPISGFELATKMGMILVPYSSLSEKKLIVAQQTSTDGFYMEPGNGKEYIFYDDSVGYERCNMTILHEIGHAVLGHSETTDSNIAEAEAAFFAKYAVAPPPLINKIHPDCSEEIADVFCISHEAAVIAWEYYRKWRKFHDASGCFTAYEKRINELYEFSN